MIFSRKAIGEKRYQSASVSVAKAFNRLAKRGLAHRKYNEGITLTKEGEDMAVMISEPTKGRPLEDDWV
jgi:Mn-dependent DtxR family transcriptional regulator